MTKNELTEMIALRNADMILGALWAKGYRDYSTDERCRRVSVGTLSKAEHEETEVFCDEEKKKSFFGEIFRGAQGVEDMEFIFLTVTDLKAKKGTFPSYHIYVKKIK